MVAPRSPEFLTVLLLLNGANFQDEMITRGSAWSETWVNVYHDYLVDFDRLLVWTNVG